MIFCCKIKQADDNKDTDLKSVLDGTITAPIGEKDNSLVVHQVDVSIRTRDCSPPDARVNLDMECFTVDDE